MSSLNAFFSASNAAQTVDKLFEKGRPDRDAFQAKPFFGVKSESRDVFVPANSASDRAMARIIEILWNVEHGEGAKTDQPKVHAVGGYILEATGTGRDDKIDLKGMAAYNLSSGAGNDTWTIKAGNLAGLDAGSGNDHTHLAADYISMIDGGGGDDIIHISGRLADDISGGDGNDTLKISANTILSIDGGAVLSITSRQTGDSIRLNFAPGALEATTPQFEFEPSRGDYLLKVF